MVYSLKNGMFIKSLDGNIANIIVGSNNRWDYIDCFFILKDTGEFYYEDTKYDITEPSLVIKAYKTEKDKPAEIFIIPCKDIVNRLVELKEIRENNRKVENLCSDCEASM